MLINKSDKTQKYIILLVSFMLLTIFIVHGWLSETDVLRMSALDMNIEQSMNKYIDEKNETFGISNDNADGYSGEVVSTGDMLFEKGTYQFMVSYNTDCDDNYCVLSSVTEMDEKGNSGVEYATKVLDSSKNGQLIEITFPNDTTDVSLKVYYETGDLNIGQLTIQRMSKDTDTICLYVFFILLFSLLGYLFLIRFNGDDEDSKKYVAIMLIIAIIYCSTPLFNDFVLKGHDTLFHLTRIEGIYEAILDHQFPMWINMYENNTYGYATPIMYPQLFLIIPALLRVCGMSLMNSYKMLLFMVNASTVLISYYSFKGIFRRRDAGAIGSLAYSLCLYRLCDVYTRGALGEMLAMAFFPLVLYGLFEVYLGNYKKWIILTLGMTGVLQSHILSAYMCTFFAGIYFIIVLPIIVKNFGKRFLAIMKAIIVTVVVNLWFLVPFVSYYSQDFKAKGASVASVEKEAIYFSQIFATFVCDNEMSIARGTTQNEMPLTVGGIFLITTALFVLIGIYFKKVIYQSNKLKRLSKAGLLTLAGAVVAIYMSLWIFPWYSFQKIIVGRLMTSIQFPWRMLGIASVLLSVVLIIVVLMMHELFPKWRRLISIVAIVLIFANSFYYMESTRDMNTIRNKEYASYTNVTDTLYTYREDDVQTIIDRGNTIEVNSGNISVSNYTKKGTNVSFRYLISGASDDTIEMEVPIYWYPGYTAYCNGREIQSGRGTDGIMKVMASDSSGELLVKYEEPIMWDVAYWVSILSVILIFFLFIIRRRKKTLI